MCFTSVCVCLLLCRPTTRVGSSCHHHSRDTRFPSLQRFRRLPCHNHTYLLPIHLPQDGIVWMREKGGVMGVIELHSPWNHHHLMWFQLLKLILPYLMTIDSYISTFCLKHQLKILLLGPLRGTSQKFIFSCQVGTRTLKNSLHIREKKMCPMSKPVGFTLAVAKFNWFRVLKGNIEVTEHKFYQYFNTIIPNNMNTWDF